MIPQEKRRLTIAEDTYIGLDAYAEAERNRQKNPIIKEMITPLSLAQKLLRNDVIKEGFYKGAVDNGEKEDQPPTHPAPAAATEGERE